MSDKAKGSAALLTLTVFYGLYGVFNRFIGEAFSTFSQQWVRNSLVMVFSVVVAIILRQKFKPVRLNDFRWIILWLLSGSWIMIALFLAFNHLSLSTAYFLFYSTMIISGVISGSIFFKEKLNLVKISSVILSLIGLLFIYSLVISPPDYWYAGFSLAAGLSLGFWNTISKKFSHHYPELQLVFYDAVTSTILGLIGFILFKESLPSFIHSRSWLWLIIYAATQVFAVGLLIYGFKHLEAQIGSLIMPIEVIFASVFGYLIFGETLSLGSFIGGTLIISGALLPNLQLFIKPKSNFG